MEHLTEIKPNTYVVNLPTFEESELAKRKKKRAQTTKATEKPKAVEKPEATETRKATKASHAPETNEVAKAKEAAQAAEIAKAAEVTQATEVTESAEVPSAPIIEDKTVTIKQVKVWYDEDTRLYTIECKDEFYDDSPDLDRIMRVVSELVPDTSEDELALLKEL
ncbi:MAG: hypothetical protein WCA08_04255 [Desulfoferrobacter sp.]